MTSANWLLLLCCLGISVLASFTSTSLFIQGCVGRNQGAFPLKAHCFQRMCASGASLYWSFFSYCPSQGMVFFCGSRFVLVLCCFGVTMCAIQCWLLFSCHQNFSVKKRLCRGQRSSLNTCVSGPMHSLIIIFLAVMPAYAITVTSTHSCLLQC